LGKKFKEGFGERGGSVVVGFDDGGDFVRRSGLGVVSVWFGVLVCVGFGCLELLHRTDSLIWDLRTVELIVEVSTDAGQGSLTVAPFLGVFFVALEWEGG
jgi:hypothetical protein